MSTAISRLRVSGRLEAFVIHLALSLVVVGLLVGLMMWRWFPGELFWLDGGVQGLYIVAAVDLVLGPLLTLMLFKRGKPKLWIDLSLIAALQIGALAYGVATTWQQRTVAIVLADRQLMSVSADAHRAANRQLEALGSEPRSIGELSDDRPALLATPAPDRESFGRYLEQLLNGWPEPHERSDQYLPLRSRLDDVEAAALDRPTLQSLDVIDEVEAVIETARQPSEALRVLRYRTRFSSGVAVVDIETPGVLRYLPTSFATASASADGGE